MKAVFTVACHVNAESIFFKTFFHKPSDGFVVFH
jgi:hypothetical protein